MELQLCFGKMAGWANSPAGSRVLHRFLKTREAMFGGRFGSNPLWGQANYSTLFWGEPPSGEDVFSRVLKVEPSSDPLFEHVTLERVITNSF